MSASYHIAYTGLGGHRHASPEGQNDLKTVCGCNVRTVVGPERDHEDVLVGENPVSCPACRKRLGADDRPVYVRQMDREKKRAEAELEGLYEGIRELERYLTSPKFRTDTRVEVNDVLLRLSEAKGYSRDRGAVAS